MCLLYYYYNEDDDTDDLIQEWHDPPIQEALYWLLGLNL